jgi:hypothetical protein
MVDFRYLYRGLCGLAHAHIANAMAGHLGAAVVAGYFVGEELPDLDEQVYLGIEKELDQIIKGDEAIWYDTKKAGISIPELFEPFPDEPDGDGASAKTGTAAIATALAGNIDKMRQSGHNVIFSAIAIRALSEHNQYATDAIINGIKKLIEKFDHEGPGRGYYGKQRGWILGNDVVLDDTTEFPAYQTQQEMVQVVIDELIRSAAIRRRGFGGLFHIINHAAAITELSRFGYEKLAHQALAAHHHHVRLWRSLPDVQQELGPLKSAKYDPRTPEYWQGDDASQWSAHLTHRVKTIYGFYTLLRLIDSDSKKKQAQEKFLYLMA